jgi:hypothetical protein
VTDRDEAGLREVLLEYNMIKGSTKTKKWLVKQLVKICEKDQETTLDLVPGVPHLAMSHVIPHGMHPPMGLAVPYHPY